MRDAIDSLGYIQNKAARVLRVGQSQAIGFVATDATSPFSADVIRSVGAVAAARGFTTLLGDSNHDEQTCVRLIKFFEAHQVAGILASPVGGSTGILERISKSGVPVVYVDSESGCPQISSVSVDHFAGGYLAISHLHSIGRQQVTLVRGPSDLKQISKRFDGAREACVEFGMTCDELVVSDYFTHGGIQAGAILASRTAASRGDAVFAANDVMAMGVIAALIDRGLSVPEDLAVVGYDDSDLSVTGRIPLTTIRQPASDIGERAASLLIDEVVTEGKTAHENTVFLPELVVRGSTLG